ncbi:MAG: glucosaminidase domain-containing protein [Oscillospiraceae bacterium]|nr:glucosaminidase domain-containing protein [Oscillospiraceae bacterium]
MGNVIKSSHKKNVIVILMTLLLLSPILAKGILDSKLAKGNNDEIFVKNLVQASYGNYEQRSFINRVGQAAMNDYSGIYPSVTIAQAILESGWGKSTLASQYNNLFGIKSDGWGGNVVNLPSKEYTANGWEYYPSYYRVYSSFEESIADHSAFLRNNYRYTAGGVFSARNYAEQAYAIQNSGYASGYNYASTLISIIQTYNLDAFDVRY